MLRLPEYDSAEDIVRDIAIIQKDLEEEEERQEQIMDVMFRARESSQIRHKEV